VGWPGRRTKLFQTSGKGSRDKLETRARSGGADHSGAVPGTNLPQQNHVPRQRRFRLPLHGRNSAAAHIASHAETETNHPLESFLLFAPDKRFGAKETDSALTARDLLGMRLRADLVVLSACETARGKIGEGDGVVGLGWAVLAAGARASMLSQWKVDSGATSDLMIDFHRRLTASKAPDKAEALRQASLDTMRSPGRLRSATHPNRTSAGG